MHGNSMKTEQDFFSTMRRSLGLPVDVDRTVQDFPDLLPAADTVSQSSKTDGEAAADLLDLLQTSCAKHHLTLHIVDDREQAAALIAEMVKVAELEFHDSRHVILHDHPLLAGLRLWKRLEDEIVTIHTCAPGDPDTREKHEICCVGITAPECVVATHGTIVQQTGDGQPRATSLLPSHHIAVATMNSVVRGLEEGFRKMREMPGSSFVFISGPSKTADIEAQLVLGAHGPRHMDLILIRT